MADKVWQVQVTVNHIVVVDAATKEEAEEIAYDAFIDDQGYWDDVDVWVTELEED